jgi:hypothetical protein
MDLLSCYKTKIVKLRCNKNPNWSQAIQQLTTHLVCLKIYHISLITQRGCLANQPALKNYEFTLLRVGKTGV